MEPTTKQPSSVDGPGSPLEAARRLALVAALAALVAASGCEGASEEAGGDPGSEPPAGSGDDPDGEVALRTAALPDRRIDEPVRIDLGACPVWEGYPETGPWSPAFDGSLYPLGATDSEAVYWALVLPTLGRSGLDRVHFELEGSFPNAAYFSLMAYDHEGQNTDRLADFEIDPVAGSQNPARDGVPHPGDPDAARYRLSLVELPPAERPADHPGDVLYVGFDLQGERADDARILLRQYRPLTREGEIGGVPLPRLSLVVEAGALRSTARLAEALGCDLLSETPMTPGGVDSFDEWVALSAEVASRLEVLPYLPGLPIPGFDPPEPPEFILADHVTGVIDNCFPAFPDDLIVRDIEEQGAYWNFDTRYLVGFLDPARDEDPMAVVRFRLPTTPDPLVALGTGGAQLRYLSVCLVEPMIVDGHLAHGTFGCVRGDELQPDPTDPSSVTLVFTRIRERPDGLCAVLDGEGGGGCSYNWMPYSGPMPYLAIRQLLPSPSFPEATLFYPRDQDPFDPELLAAHMGDYYPRTAYCTMGRFLVDHCGTAGE